MSFKRTKVVMLPTNEKAKEGMLVYFNNLYSNKEHYLSIIETIKMQDYLKVWARNGLLTEGKDCSVKGVYQHLYFLSDEEIKEGDWYYVPNQMMGYEHISNEIINEEVQKSIGAKKIIATTDKKLFINIPDSKHYNSGMYTRSLPEPSERFIQKFVDAYNSGKPITEVNVEYLKGVTIVDELQWENQERHLKVNPKDNTITIKKVKDSWSREEVELLIRDFNDHKEGIFDCTKWIEENL